MFKHENAPVCKNLTNCSIKKCQFSHHVFNDKGADSETANDIPYTSDCELCQKSNSKWPRGKLSRVLRV